MTTEELGALGVESPEVFSKLLQLGWYDNTGRSLTWKYWHKFYAQRRTGERD